MQDCTHEQVWIPVTSKPGDTIVALCCNCRADVTVTVTPEGVEKENK